MKIINILTGSALILIGIAIGYVDYYIVSLFYEVSLWLSGLVNAPGVVAVLITLILMFFFITILVLILIVAIILIVVGLLMIISN